MVTPDIKFLVLSETTHENTRPVVFAQDLGS